MRQKTIRLLAIVLVLGVPALAADSRQAGLQVSVVVTRQCSVTTSATMEVTCTRAQGGAVQTSQDGRAAQPTPLVTTGPGITSASVPLSQNTTVVAIQF